MAWEEIKDQFSIEDIGAPLLANLAKGIYSPEAVLREYVQNGADAYVDLEEVQKKKLPATEKPIDIYLQDNNTLTVQDSGIGMNGEEIKHYKRIALSPKINKDRAGFRGIGIWAGFSACDALQVETSKLGDPHKYRLTLQFEEMRKLVDHNIDIKQLVDKRFKVEGETAKASDHYTQVRLVSLHNEFKDLLKPEELERIVSQILPCRVDPEFKYADKITQQLKSIDGYQEFTINVKDVEIFKRFPANATEPVYITLKRDDVELAFVWYCASQTARSFKQSEGSNFRLRVRNIGLGGPGIYSQENGSHWGVSNTISSSELLDWYFGEIHILDSNVKPNTPRSELELDAHSRRAITRIRDFFEERITFRRANSDVNSHLKQISNTKDAISKGAPFTEDAATRLLKDMNKYESILKRPKTKLAGIDVEKRKILKQAEANDPDIGKNRRDVIEFLERAAGSPSAQTGKRGKASKGTKEIREETVPSNGRGSSVSDVIVDYEKIFDDIVVAIEKHLDGQEDLASKLAEAVEDVFKRYGLLVPA